MVADGHIPYPMDSLQESVTIPEAFVAFEDDLAGFLIQVNAALSHSP